ncbi:MAG: helix-turn-helix transcriptional regulator [Bacteroidales bacterium]|nr:helix-turn-helix transcriptional regulator [Bacteroidales bacterium]
MNRIGERIKKKRVEFNLQLNELAEKIGISPSALSQIEKAKSFPSILTLKTIAEKLHTTVGELIGENDSLANNPVVYKSDIKFFDQNKSGTMFYILSQHDTNKQMDTYLVRFSKASAIDGFFACNFGQVFSYVLSGKVRFDLNGKSFVLQPGDNIYFNAKSQFNAINYFDDISEIIWVQSPPQF